MNTPAGACACDVHFMFRGAPEKHLCERGGDAQPSVAWSEADRRLESKCKDEAEDLTNKGTPLSMARVIASLASEVRPSDMPVAELREPEPGEDLTDHPASLPSQFIRRGTEPLHVAIGNSLQVMAACLGAHSCALLQVEGARHRVRAFCSEPYSGKSSGFPQLAREGKLPWLYETVVGHCKPVAIDSLDDLPVQAREDRAALERCGIQSTLWLPLGGARPAQFALAIASRREQRWSDQQKAALQVLGTAFVQALQRQLLVERPVRAARLERAIGRLLAVSPGTSWAQIDDHIQHALEKMLACDDADQIALFEVEERAGNLHLTHVAQAAGGRDGPALVEFPHSAPWMYAQVIQRGATCSFSSTSEFPPAAAADRELMEAWGVRSGLYIPLQANGQVCKVLAAVSYRQERSWTREFLEGLKVLGRAIVSAITLQRTLEERARGEFELARSQQLAQCTLDAFHECLCVIDSKGSVIQISDGWRDFSLATGSPDLTVGDDFFLRASAAVGPYAVHVQRLSAGVLAVLGGQQESFAMESSVAANREERCFHSRARRLVLGTSRYAAISHDEVTDRKHRERELQELRAEQWHTERVTRTGLLIASLAHELSQPLTAILSNAQAGMRFLEREHPDLREIGEIFRDIAHDNKRAGEVIESLRLMLRRQQSERSAVNLAGLVRDVTVLLRNELMVAQVEVATDFEDSCAALVDRAQIQQVLLNLMMNAKEAMASKPPSQRQLTLEVRTSEPGEVQVAVRDTGMGIPKEQFRNIFDAFWTTKTRGTGLGLAVSRSIVEAHGGHIAVESTGGAGTTFIVSLPAAARPAVVTDAIVRRK